MEISEDQHRFIDEIIKTSNVNNVINISSVFYSIKGHSYSSFKDNEYVSNIISVMYHLYNYIESPNGNELQQGLKNEGIQAKKAGGHIAYQKELKRISERAEDLLQKDWLSKKWYYKYRWLSVIVSILALIVSILSFFKEEIKELLHVTASTIK